MSFPQNLMESFTAKEIVYLAETEPVEIISKVSMNDKLELITTELPKLRAMTSYQIPFWLAIILRKQNKITVIPPKWLNEKYLLNMYHEEVNKPDIFSQLPANWLEISKIFLKNFKEDLIDDPDTILKLIQDLKEIRSIKLKKGLNNLNEINLSLNDLSLMEINEFRPFISKVMGRLATLQNALDNEEGGDNYGNNEIYEEEKENHDNGGDGIEKSKQSETFSEEPANDHEDMEMEDIINEFEL